MPPLEFDSRGTWVDVPSSAIEKMAALNLDARSGVHAANHALLIVAPLFVVSDPSDIATEHVYPRQHRPRPLRLILYDARPGGLGAADALFRRFHAALGQARRLLSECPCRFSAGCPACLHVHTCSGYNANFDRRAARIIVDAVLAELRSIFSAVSSSRRRGRRGCATRRSVLGWGLLRPWRAAGRRRCRIFGRPSTSSLLLIWCLDLCSPRVCHIFCWSTRSHGDTVVPSAR